MLLDGETTLDPLTKDILLCLMEQDGSATTSDVRETVGVESTKRVKYRVRTKLQPHGLVRVEKRGKDEYGRDLPHRIHLTETGEALCESYENELRSSDGLDVEERVDRLERQFDRLREEVIQLRFGDPAGDSDA
jgi:predicted MarR family transcription regulator